MESQVKGAADAIKQYIKKWEAVSTEMYKKYIGKDAKEIAKYTTLDQDYAKMEEAIAKLDRLPKLVTEVEMAAGMYRGSGQPGTSTMRIQRDTMERLIKEAKEQQKKPPAAPPKPPAGPSAKPSPNAGRPLPKPPVKPAAAAAKGPLSGRRPPPGYAA